MVQLIDACIIDDPLGRRMQLLEVVLTHCAPMLWPHQKEKLKQVGGWLTQLRRVMKAKSRRESPQPASELADSPRSTPPRKSGKNGLSAASADIVVCKDHRRSDGQRAKPRPPPMDGVDFLRVGGDVVLPVLNGASPMKTETLLVSSISQESGSYPNVGAENNRVQGCLGQSTRSNLSNSVVSHRSNDDLYDPKGHVFTPATMWDGEVVLVTETGSPLKEEVTLPDLSFLPLRVKRLSGGITNELFHIYDEGDETASVVVRVFGKETDRVISRESELFYQSLFIPTHVHGTNFLVYNFLDGYETLPYTEMAMEATPIAHAMAEFQVRATKAARLDRGRPLLRDSQNSEYWESLDMALQSHVDGADSGATTAAVASILTAAKSGGSKRPSRFDRESNYTINSLTRWVELISSKEILEKVREEKREAFLAISRDLCEGSKATLHLLEGQRQHLCEGVCHNDILSANIMRNISDRSLQIIDFDYTKRNYLLFDVANHFNEYPGLDCDYATYFPTDAHMVQFITEYRRGMRAALEKAWESGDSGVDDDAIFLDARKQFWTESEEEETAVVLYWVRLVKLLTLASHLSWGTWSLLQEAVSALDVDFLDYSKLRLNRYLETRDQFTSGF